MEALQHDPRTKQQIKDTLFDFLYGPVKKQFAQRLETIITKNAILVGASHKSFSYKGELYSCDIGVPPKRANRLTPQLQPAMDDYLKELKHLNNHELPYVLGFLTHVLNASNHLHDYLRVFPGAIHRPIENYINSCPGRTQKLTEFDVECIQNKHQSSINLIKQRMVSNLLI